MKSKPEKVLEHIRPRQLSQEEKHSLWSSISERLSEAPASQPLGGTFIHSFKRTFRKRFMAVIALLLAFLVGSFSTTAALANNAAPGDFLFPVDIAAENILLTLSFGNSKDELRLQFAEERLDEVKALLALANIAEISASASSDSSNNSIADTSNSAGTSTATTTQSTSTSSTQSTSTNSGTNDNASTSTNKNTFKNLAQAENAFLVALNQLEGARDKLQSKGNDIGVSVITDMIAELSDLVQNHLAALESYNVKVDQNDNRIKVAIQVTTDEIKTKFNLDQNLNSNKVKNNVAIKANNNGSSVKINDGEFKVSQTVQENKKQRDEDREDRDERTEREERKSDRFTICRIVSGSGKKAKFDSKKVSSSSLAYYLDRGYIVGKCKKNDKDKDDDDDDQNDKKIVICHKGINTITISNSALWAHLLHGDRKGACPDNDDDNDTSSPTIQNLQASIDIRSATVNWTTNENATSTVWYGTTTPLELKSPTLKVVNNTFKKSHSSLLSNLNPNTTYYLVVVVSDAAGNITTSIERSIKTLPIPDPGDITPPVITNIAANPSMTSANISWETNENATSKVWFKTTSPVQPAVPTEFVSSGSLVQNRTLTLNGLTASTTYFYIVESVDGSGNKATSTEHSFTTTPAPAPQDTTPPALSGITASATTTESVISWTSDEPATSRVLYSSSTPVSANTALIKSSELLVTNHTLTITGLLSNNLYYYIVVSTDEAGNSATSSERSFTTTTPPPPADTTSPLLSAISSSELSSTTAKISWSTDEIADGIVYYGTENPLNTNSALILQSSTPVQDHLFNLSGLIASTTYQYIVTSSDASQNTATSTQQSFSTL